MIKIRAIMICVALLVNFKPSFAAFDINLSGTPESSVITVSLSGTNVATATFTERRGLANPGVEFSPTFFDPFPPEVTGNNYGRIQFSSGSAHIANITTGQVYPVFGIWMQDSSNSPSIGMERFGLITSDSENVYGMRFSSGDQLELMGSASIDTESLNIKFKNFNVGSVSNLCELGLCFNLSVKEVPEPASGSLMIFGMVFILLFKCFSTMARVVKFDKRSNVELSA
ncbi:MAG TPA: hypothetical protein VFW84_02660 [Aquabacterium sp.]|uniref:hypothetical protein n=1 Tax=Aquabacterium sp. TaxID=1872578 RepID=UPI002E3785B4|nr:hypothetical protein [Aquabacterium sp.]HEX5371614.1 hypothetical protein [Aquabacterium sp.]